jgi:hypothetical protein
MLEEIIQGFYALVYGWTVELDVTLHGFNLLYIPCLAYMIFK